LHGAAVADRVDPQQELAGRDLLPFFDNQLGDASHDVRGDVDFLEGTNLPRSGDQRGEITPRGRLDADGHRPRRTIHVRVDPGPYGREDHRGYDQSLPHPDASLSREEGTRSLSKE